MQDDHTQRTYTPKPRSKGARRLSAQNARDQLALYRKYVDNAPNGAQLHRLGLAAKHISQLVALEIDDYGLRDAELRGAIQRLYAAADVVMKAGR